MLILSVLKIIGIIILAVLSLVLFIVLLILFAPIRYKLDGSFADEALSGTASAGWLLSLVSVRAAYNKGNEPKAYVSIFGIKVYDFLNDNEESAEKGNAEKESADNAESSKTADISEPSYEADDKGLELSGTIEAQTEKESTNITDRHTGDSLNKATEKRKITFSQLISGVKSDISRILHTVKSGIISLFYAVRSFIDGVFATARAFIDSVFETLRAAYASLSEKTGKAQRLYAIIKDERYKDAVALFKRCTVNILREIKPKKGKGSIVFGSGDPYSTGRIMELAAVCYPIYRDVFEITPDFTGAQLDARMNVRGRVRIFFIAFPVLRIYFNKELKQMYKRLRTELEL